MPAPYTLPTPTEMSSLHGIAKYLTDIANFMPYMLGVIWIVGFVGSLIEGWQASKCFVFSSAICASLSIVLALLNMLNPQFMYFSFLMVGVGVVWYKLDNAPII